MPSVSFVSLGCPKNLVDSEKMLGLLAEAGCAIVGDGSGLGDVLIVNTCGFLSASRDEAVGILQEAAEHKRNGDIQRIVAAGCLVQRDGQGLMKDVPEIDALVGVHNRSDIVRAVTGKKRSELGASGGADDSVLFLGEYHASSWTEANRSDQTRLRLTPAHYAYLRMGTKEGQQIDEFTTAIRDTRDLVKVFESAGLEADKDFKYVEVEGGEHNEASWAKRFGDMLMFAYGKDGD